MHTQADEFPESSKLARHLSFRTMLSLPLMREGVVIGTIALRRTEARLFTEQQVALLQTFPASRRSCAPGLSAPR
jgi:GAF domain-containing protein